jgi:hypothetical protein
MVLHFASADNRDFEVAFPEKTFQFNVVPDLVLAYKNMDDRRRANKDIEAAVERDAEVPPSPLIIKGMLNYHYFELRKEEDKKDNHGFTSSEDIWDDETLIHTIR